MGGPFRKTTALAIHLIWECDAPKGVTVLVLFDADDLCHTIVQACRVQRCRLASTLKGNCRLSKSGWKLKAGHYGKNVFRRRRTTSLVLQKPHGRVRYHSVDAVWLKVSTLWSLHVVFSRKGSARRILGLVTDYAELSAAGLIQTYENRWAMELFFKDNKQLLGLGSTSIAPMRPPVTHLYPAALDYAILTRLRLIRHDSQGRRIEKNAAHWSTAAVQDHLRGLLWDDLVAYCPQKHHVESVLMELQRLRVA
jgi:hypothetical protein